MEGIDQVFSGTTEGSAGSRPKSFPGEVPGSGKIGVGMVKGYTPKISSWNLKKMVNASDDFAPVPFSGSSRSSSEL